VASSGKAWQTSRGKCEWGTLSREDAQIGRLAVAGYLTEEMKMRQALAGTFSTLPSRSLVSRTITAPGAVATSTHSPPLAPE
jgi:hypothetical protein